MTLPTGTISMSQVATELGISQTGLSLNHSWVRQLAGQNSGPVSMSNLRGQTGKPNFNATASGPDVPCTVPFFRGTTSLLTNGPNPTSPLTLAFQTAPNWNGKIQVTNNSAGLSAVLTKQDSVTWSASSYPTFIIRSGSTDNWTFSPSN